MKFTVRGMKLIHISVRMKNSRWGILLTILLGMFLAGCGGSSTLQTSSSQPVSTPVAEFFGVWGNPVLVNNEFLVRALPPYSQIAMDGAGNSYLATINPSSPYVVSIYRKPSGQSWGSPSAISPIKTLVPYWSYYTQGLTNLQMRVDRAGNIFALWEDFDRTSPGDRAFISHVYSTRFESATGWNTPIVMQSNPQEYAFAEHLSVQGNGTAWLVWTERTYADPVSSIYDTYALFTAKYVPLTGWGLPEKNNSGYF